MTSHDVIDTIRRVLGIKKAGHTGTLDPGAAGVLVVCLGVATRLARFLLNDDKEYRAEITFGLTTSTGDSFGDKIAEGDARQLTEHDTRSTLELFTGAISQVPPMTSALKWHGQKLYELARSGQVVDRTHWSTFGEPDRAVRVRKRCCIFLALKAPISAPSAPIWVSTWAVALTCLSWCEPVQAPLRLKIPIH